MSAFDEDLLVVVNEFHVAAVLCLAYQREMLSPSSLVFFIFSSSPMVTVYVQTLLSLGFLLFFDTAWPFLIAAIIKNSLALL